MPLSVNRRGFDRMFKKRRIFAVLLLAQMVFYVGCIRGYITVEYIFPNGFQGPAVIRVRQSAGVPACEVDYLRPGSHRCVLTFPPSAVLNIQGEAPETQNQYHASARYANGTAIPIRGVPQADVSNKTAAVWSLGFIREGEDWLFVGTEDEFMKFKEEKGTYKYPNSPSPPR